MLSRFLADIRRDISVYYTKIMLAPEYIFELGPGRLTQLVLPIFNVS